MAATQFQREICRIVAASRKSRSDSYVAGGVALNTLIQAARVSRDIDLFHDTNEAVLDAWESDRELLSENGYRVTPKRQLPSFVEAIVKRDSDSVLMQWARDSAFRFFPLMEDETFGLTLHPFDLATNKVLALAGRLEARDWIDAINCHAAIQNLGYLIWAACGKNPGFSPVSLLSEAKRSSHYSAEEIEQLSFQGEPPDAFELGRAWHAMLKEAEKIVELLPPQKAGQCVIGETTNLFSGNPRQLAHALNRQALHFHRGTIKGALPVIATAPDSI